MCPNYSGRHWRSVYHPTRELLNNPAGIMFIGDTRNSDFASGYYSCGPGEWYMRPGWGRIHGSLGFDRHLG